MMDQHDITGLILAGGLSTRMGRKDKAWLLYQGVSMVEQVVARLRPQVGALLISANRNLEPYQMLAERVLPDARPGYLGPLAGIATALSVCTTDWLLVAPCDAPHLPVDLAQRLSSAVAANHAKLAYPHDGKQSQHLFMLVHVDCLRMLEHYLLQGQRKVALWVQNQDSVEVDFSDQPDAFININKVTEC